MQLKEKKFITFFFGAMHINPMQNYLLISTWNSHIEISFTLNKIKRPFFTKPYTTASGSKKMFCFEAVFWSLVTKLVLSIWSSGLQWKNKYSTQTQLSNLPDLYQWCPLAMEFNETSSIKYKNIIITQVFLFINHTLGPPLLYSRPWGHIEKFYDRLTNFIWY